MKCPKCKRETEYNKDNPYRPFCSERCKMVDLGQWANEEYAIPSREPVPLNELENEERLEDDNQRTEDYKSGRRGNPRDDLH
jgi:endogenous inhibitor of DNA gyrase (YacG/DUF329 family)